MALTVPITEHWADVEEALAQAVTTMAEGASRDWTETMVRIEYAKILQQVGRVEQAYTLFRKTAAADPLSIRARIELALARAATGWGDRAARQLDVAKRMTSGWLEIPYYRFQIEFFYRDLRHAAAQLKDPHSDFAQALPLLPRNG